ncbi:MAG: prolipoprotein diacylglyceryl transferase [Lachnospiraceae bacterium]|nr:prolipoprotein diacylglyceryl transferase [Lachnospiraceae bacterium]
MYDIRFPHLGITFHNLKDGFTIFGFEIKFYGVIIGLGFLLAYLLVLSEAKRTKQDTEIYLDFFLCLVIPAILGARIYYIIFNTGEYFGKEKSFGQTIKGLINIRNGGLAIYGGIIAGVITAIIFCKNKKINFFLFTDTISLGLLLGQILGRWGNFFNREAFGEYTDSFFAMQIPTEYFMKNGSLKNLEDSGVITGKMAENLVTYGQGENIMHWISVHPTFLYESLWNLALLIFLLIYRKYKKFDGEMGLLYLWGYGLGRVWIEGLRTDSLMVPGLNMRVSQLLAAICVVAASVILVKKRLDYIKENIGNNS